MRYLISAPVTISAYTVVQAESEEEAIEEAMGRQMQHLCYGCSNQENIDDEWTIGDIDGEPDATKFEIREAD